MITRSLRSNSRFQKLRLQNIRQANEILRVKLNDRIETTNENFEQTEFLSLFGLTPNNASKCTIEKVIRQHYENINNHDFLISSKLKKSFGKQ